MNKTEWRKSIMLSLQSLLPDERDQIETRLYTNLIQSSLWKQAERIGITISQGLEWDTKPIVESSWAAGKRVCIPKCIPEKKQMVFYDFFSYDDLEIVYYNLREPKPEPTKIVTKEQIDLLIVPGVVFDKQGYRIGFGGGYYDRFLAEYPNQSLSLVYSGQLIDRIPREDHDLPVDHLITETGKLGRLNVKG